MYFGLSGLDLVVFCLDQGRRASRLPLAFISRAFGASAFHALDLIFMRWRSGIRALDNIHALALPALVRWRSGIFMRRRLVRW